MFFILFAPFAFLQGPPAERDIESRTRELATDTLPDPPRAPGHEHSLALVLAVLVLVVVRACAQNGLLEEAAAREAMQMIDDRNLTAHTYNEPLAIAIFSRLPGHTSLLRNWLGALSRNR